MPELTASDQEFLAAMFANLTGPINVNWKEVSKACGIAYERNTRSRYRSLCNKMGWPHDGKGITNGGSPASSAPSTPRAPRGPRTPSTKASGGGIRKSAAGRVGTKKNAHPETPSKDSKVDDEEEKEPDLHAVKKEDPDLQMEPEESYDPNSYPTFQDASAEHDAEYIDESAFGLA